MSKTEGSGKGQPPDREALQARVAYAIDLANWADGAPQPPTTMAKSMNEILADTCRQLARISACYNLNEALNDATDGRVLSDDPAAQEYFEQVKEDVGAAMDALDCKSIL